MISVVVKKPKVVSKFSKKVKKTVVSRYKTKKALTKSSTKPPKKKSSAGRPTKYDPKFCKMLIDHFSVPTTQKLEMKHFDKDGNYRWSDYKVIPNPFPTFLSFAMKIKVDDDTLENWAKEENKKKYPGFFGAYARAKVLQKHFLIENGLTGLYNGQFAIFVAKNVTDMKDKQETEHSGSVIWREEPPK